MSAIDDLNAAVTNLTTLVAAQNDAVVAELAAVTAALQTSGNGGPAIEAAVASLNALGVTIGQNTTQIANETASLTPASTPTPTPTPTPTSGGAAAP